MFEGELAYSIEVGLGGMVISHRFWHCVQRYLVTRKIRSEGEKTLRHEIGLINSWYDFRPWND